MDRHIRYDVGGQPLVFIQNPTAEDNIYIGLSSYLFGMPSCEESDSQNDIVDMPLGDPVVKAAREVVWKFLRDTFWCQIEGFKAIQAGLALAKRGLNVPQAIIHLGDGGVGLSLFTSLISGSLGEDLHKFFDPAIFYDDEELRKVVELMAEVIVFTGQERPQGIKKSVV